MGHKPWRITFLITNLDEGGAQMVLRQVLTRLPADKYQIQVISLMGPKKLSALFEKDCIPVVYLNMGVRGRVRVFADLLNILHTFRPHIVNTFLFQADIIGRVAARLAGVPLVVSSVRVSASYLPRAALILDGWTARLADTITAVSSTTADFLTKHEGIDPGKIIVIPNGVDLCYFNNRLDNSGRAKHEFGIPQGMVTATVVGRLHAQKGHEYFLNAAAKILSELPDVAILLAGMGPLDQYLRGLCQSLGIQDRVYFLGHLDDVRDVLLATDVFVLPSLYEGMPNSVLEAMAMGLPVVATAVDGIREIVKDRETGFLVPPKNIEMLADRMKILLIDPDQRKKMGAASLLRVQEHFTIEHTVRRIDMLYTRLLQHRYGRHRAIDVSQ